MNVAWISPASGAALHRTAPHVLAAGDERWPVIDDIPFLRLDRRALADRALAAIDAGDASRAAAILLTDQDPFAPDAPPSVEDNLALLAAEPHLSFREAMARLRLGRVADYFAHRWSDPTFLSGLVLATAFMRGPVLELACGAGHFIPELARAGLDPVGADLVFAKLWLCRHFIAPDATLVCFDAQRPWPLRSRSFGGAFCHDAFYFLPDKPTVVAEMRRVCATDAVVAIGHAHNVLVDNHSAGLPLAPVDYAELLDGDVTLFDDRVLTATFVSGMEARGATPASLADAEAISLLSPGSARLHPERLERQPRGTLRLNPLYRRDAGASDARIAWPSERYAAEYGPLATYPATWTGADTIAPDHNPEAVRRRIYLDLPARW